MSNYAPNPNNQDIYNQLATIPLSEVTAEQIEKLTGPVTLSSNNQDSLLTMNTVNQAAMRDGMAMPDTGIIVKVTSTDNATLTVLKPNPGEVWQLNAASATATGGAVRFKLGLITGDVPDITSDFVEIADVSPTSTSIQFSFVDLPGPLYVDSKTWMVINFSSIGVGEEGDCRVAFVRVR